MTGRFGNSGAARTCACLFSFGERPAGAGGWPEAGNLALCAEKTPGPSETEARLSGSFPSAAISWRQKGANYALAGALSAPELYALAESVRAQVEAFDGK